MLTPLKQKYASTATTMEISTPIKMQVPIFLLSRMFPELAYSVSLGCKRSIWSDQNMCAVFTNTKVKNMARRLKELKLDVTASTIIDATIPTKEMTKLTVNLA